MNKLGKRTKIRLAALGLCTLTVLTVCALSDRRGLEDYRAAARYSAGLSYEETAGAVERLSRALARSRYATDGPMCAKICCEAYAAASAAESALSTLPFATQELEQLSAFLNVAGDYAYCLSGEAAEQGFSREQIGQLSALSRQAADLSESLRQTREDLNDGLLRYDSREKRLQNVGEEPGKPLSERMLDTEGSVALPEDLEYDGRYGCKSEPKRGYLTEQEMLEQAALFAGKPTEELRPLYEYQGLEGRRCYRTGDLFVCVSRWGVETMGQARLVSEEELTEQEAREQAEEFLESRGFADLRLERQQRQGAVLLMEFCAVRDEAVCLDNSVTVGIALDDGSVYSFSAENYCRDPLELSWEIGAEEAQATLPEELTVTGERRVVLKSAGLRDLACYEFSCRSREGESVTILVDAATGRQAAIEL